MASEDTAQNTRILKEISKELVHLENMASRVQSLTTRFVRQSYIDRILLRIEYTKRSFKELRDRVKYESVVEDIRKEAGETTKKTETTKKKTTTTVKRRQEA